jgi:hypothetical protein
LNAIHSQLIESNFDEFLHANCNDSLTLHFFYQPIAQFSFNPYFAALLYLTDF